MVSVLEGGYRIQGKIVSAFARSVAAHVRALLEPNLQVLAPCRLHANSMYLQPCQGLSFQGLFVTAHQAYPSGNA